MIVVGGLNPLAACEENNISTRNIAMGSLFEFKELTSYTKFNSYD